MSGGEPVAALRLAEASRRIVDGVASLGATWIRGEAMRIVDAWGRLDQSARRATEHRLASAAESACTRVVGELNDLFALSVAEQRSTPLAIVRTIVSEPTVVLADAGIPAVERDQFAASAFPGDRYGLVPADLGVLGDPDLAAIHVVWGLAKAELVRKDRTVNP